MNDERGVLTRGLTGNEYRMTYRMNRWLNWTAWIIALAATGTACTGSPVDFESGNAGTGGDSGSGASGDTGGSGGTTTSGTGGALGGTGGALVGAAGTTTVGDAGEGATDPYAPRTGSFKALIYSEANGFVHVDSIREGQRMFADLASQFDFEIAVPSPPGDFRFTAESLESYELVVFLNTSGEILDPDEKAAFEEWIVSNHGAFVGIHAAADTEQPWAFYKELTGQFHDQHTQCCSEAQIVWQPEVLDFPAVKGLPSPWTHTEEWYRFRQVSTWSEKPGFKILGTVEVEGETQPVSFVREFGNFRSFYTSIGHEAPTFREYPEVRHHIAGGLLWAVRREHLLD